ncbi:MAG: hypothetical protein KGJ13_05075 [Patescibacteria group bacterium]|nr:hypothetical protein [Patescibacteria group bacterium]
MTGADVMIAIVNVTVLVVVAALQGYNAYQHSQSRAILSSVATDLANLKVYVHEKFVTKEQYEQARLPWLKVQK